MVTSSPTRRADHRRVREGAGHLAGAIGERNVFVPGALRRAAAYIEAEWGRFFYPDRGNFIGIVSDLRCRTAMRRLATAFRAQSDFPLQTVSTFRFIPGVAWSDHHSFWRQGYPAVMVTDTAFYRYRHYHAATDTPDKLAYPELAQVTLGLFKAFAVLAREGVG